MRCARHFLYSIACHCLMLLPGSAGATGYSTVTIPPAMLVNADVVKREETIRISIQNLHKVDYYHRYVLTILNENGDKYAQAEKYYNKLHSINYIRGTLYDAAGNEVKKLHKNDITDYSGTGQGTFADDYRVQKHSFYYRSYPYTVEYEISESQGHTMAFPGWQPVEGERMSVIQSTLEVSCARDYEIRYRALHYDGSPAITTVGDVRQLTWKAEGLAAIEKEYASPYRSELTPTVFLAPTRFQLTDHAGTMDSWQSFGRFIYNLNSGADVLPESTKAAIHQLADTCRNTGEKITRLYRYLQQNTRYVGIQLGIGGWQPYDATYVAERKYGDCKALVNFMQALLKEAGIPSFYTLVNAGANNKFFVPDFPSSGFNHVILAVPLPGDTVWLECTSQTMPPGYLSSFTADRYALMIAEQGGTLVHTPAYGIKDNEQLRSIESTVDTNGNLTIHVITRYRGLLQDELSKEVHSLSKEKLLNWLKESELNLPDYDVLNYSFAEEFNNLPCLTERIDVAARNYAQVSGRRLFISPNLLSKTGLQIADDEVRRNDIVLHTAAAFVDTVIIHLPEGYTAESLPTPVVLDTDFGRYSSSVKLVGPTLYYYRKLERRSGQFPAKAYTALVHFYNRIYKADREKAVLVRL